jgi:hypothetical protein
MDTFLADYWDPEGAAAYVQKTPRTLKAWRDQRIGPPVTYIGGKPYYRKDSFKRWLLSLEGRPLRRTLRRGRG